MTLAMYVWVLLAAVLANLPFVSTRWFGLRVARKVFWQYAVEWLAAYALAGLLACVLEARAGTVHAQGVTFYVVTLLMFAVFAFPGFVWRYFWRGKFQQ